MGTSFREEFRIKNLSPSQTREELFYLPQLRIPPIIFVLYRIIIAGYVDVSILLGTVKFSNQSIPYSWPVYLTNWTYFVLACHVTLAALIAVLHNVEDSGQGCCYRHRRHTEDLVDEEDLFEHDLGYCTYTVPWYMKLDWILFSIVINMAVIVTIAYFAFLYPSMDEPSGTIPFLDLNFHGINTVIVVVELLFSAIPVRLLHMIYPLVYGICYIVFSAIYWSYDHSVVIYPKILDWNNPGQTMLFLLITGFVICPILQLVLYGIYRLRLHIFVKCAD